MINDAPHLPPPRAGLLPSFCFSRQQSKDPFQCSQREMRFTQEHLLSDDDVVFECGAHHGWTTLRLARFLINITKRLHVDAKA